MGGLSGSLMRGQRAPLVRGKDDEGGIAYERSPLGSVVAGLGPGGWPRVPAR